MSNPDMDALRNENQLLRLKISALEDQLEAVKRQHTRHPDLLEGYGLVDERYFTRRLHEAILSAERYARFVTVIMVVFPDQDSDPQAGKNIELETAAKLRNELRQTDLVGFSDSGKVFILLEESDPQQTVLALRRVSEEIVERPEIHFALANYPNDANRDESLLEVLNHRTTDLRFRFTETHTRKNPLVHLGEEVLSLSN